jgi:hypothetical protein
MHKRLDNIKMHGATVKTVDMLFPPNRYLLSERATYNCRRLKETYSFRLEGRRLHDATSQKRVPFTFTAELISNPT